MNTTNCWHCGELIAARDIIAGIEGMADLLEEVFEKHPLWLWLSLSEGYFTVDGWLRPYKPMRAPVQLSACVAKRRRDLQESSLFPPDLDPV